MGNYKRIGDIVNKKMSKNREATRTVELLKKKNVVIVYRGKKTIGDVKTDRDCIIVGVTKKLPLSQLKKIDIVPVVINKIETDVVETAPIQLLQAEKYDRTIKWRPAPGGVSCGHKDITAGTLGMIVRKNGEQFILSNNHVLANVNRGQISDSIYQPGSYHGGKEVDTIAELSEFIRIRVVGESDCLIGGSVSSVFNFLAKILGRKTRLYSKVIPENIVDCALAKPLHSNDVSHNILEIGYPVKVIEPSVGLRIKKSGCTTAVTHGEISDINAGANVSMGNGDIAIFIDQILIEKPGFSAGGDSGSIILSEDGNNVIGLLFAGNNTLTLANKFTNVVSELELDLDIARAENPFSFISEKVRMATV